MTFEEACHEVARNVADLVIRKQHDYGHDNILSFGEFGVLVRLNDKVARLKNLQGMEAKNETVDDTWMDVAGYALIALMLRRGTFTMPLEAPGE